MDSQNTRRGFLRTSAIMGTGLLLSSCSRGTGANQGKEQTGSASAEDENKKGGEVTATEDLMREHGILRRALLVYTAAATKLHANLQTFHRTPCRRPPSSFAHLARSITKRNWKKRTFSQQ